MPPNVINDFYTCVYGNSQLTESAGFKNVTMNVFSQLLLESLFERVGSITETKNERQVHDNIEDI